MLYIIDMVKELGLWVVVEGVEIEVQLVYLYSWYVEFGQGWLFLWLLLCDEFVVFYQKWQQQYGVVCEYMQNLCSVLIECEGVEQDGEWWSFLWWIVFGGFIR